MIKWFGLRLKYIVGKMTGKQQKQTYQMYQPWSWLSVPCLAPKETPIIKRRIVIRIEIPEKLTRFLLYFVVLNTNGCWNWGSFDLVSSLGNCSIFTSPVDSTSFISMSCSWVLMDGAGIILDLGILKITFVWLYFFTKSIDKLINITARQGMSKIQSFLEIKKRWIRWKIKHILWIFMILFLYCILWQYRLWSFQSGGTKSERVLPKNQHTQKKVLNFENWTNGEPQ